MSKGKILWRESFWGWPTLRVHIELAPWHWRIHWWRDDVDHALSVNFGPIGINGFAERKHSFRLERAE